MQTVQQIERAIDAPTPGQREQLYLWPGEHYLQPGDIQLKAAIDAGRFDDRIARRTGGMIHREKGVLPQSVCSGID